MAAVAEDEVVVSEPGGLNPRRVPVANVAASWEIGAAGSFSCFVRIADLRAVGLGRSLTGLWIAWAHPSLGRWAGVITGRPVADGVAELAAEGNLTLLRGRVLAEQDVPPPGSAGGIIRRAVVAAGRTGTTYVTVGEVDGGGEYVAVETGGGDVADDVLPGIAALGGFEFAVDADRVLTAKRRLGRDRSGSVRLVEDRHVVGFRIDDDLWSSAAGTVYVPTGVAAVPLAPVAAPPATPAPTPGAPTPAPGGTIGRVGGSALVSALLGGLLSFAGRGTGNRATGGSVAGGWAAGFSPAPPPWSAPLGAAAGAAGAPWPGEGPEPDAWAAANAAAAVAPPGVGANNPAVPAPRFAPLPTVPIELEVANTDGVWARIGLGDTVRVELGSVGFAGRVRAVALAIDVANGVLVVSGEALADA